MKRAAIYVRVSTASESKHGDAVNFVQNPEVQEELPSAMVAQRSSFHIVVVWRFDRFARSVKQVVLALEEFRALGIDFISHQEALDTSTLVGEATFTIIAAMAKLERSIIRERVVSGLEHAKRFPIG